MKNIIERQYEQFKKWLHQLGQKPLLPSVTIRSGLPKLYFRVPLQKKQKNVFARFYERVASYFK